MIFALDPFQIVRSAAADRVVIEAWDDISVSGSVNSDNFAFCDSSLDFINYIAVSLAGYFSAEIICSAGDLTITGQTSGATMGFGIPIEYAQTNDCIGNCWVWDPSGDGGVFKKSFGGFDPFNETFELTQFLYHKQAGGFGINNPPPFINGELVDISLPAAPKQIIGSITERTPTTVYVNMTAHDFADFSWITIAGTESYDGIYRVEDPSADQFWITAPYVEDESVGTAQRNYEVRLL